MDNKVTISDLAVSYGRHEALSGISLELHPGHIYGLLGRNGAGKSTLIKALAGGLPLTRGSIDAFGFTPFARRASFLADTFLAGQDVRLPAMNPDSFVDHYAPFWPRFSRRLFADYCAELEVTPGRRLHRLSQGEQRRFALAFALAVRARLTLLDEPMAGLDIVARNRLLKIISRQDNAEGITLISSHETAGLENIFTDLIVIDRGSLLLCAAADDIASAVTFSAEGRQPDTLYADGLRSIAVNPSGFPADIDLDLLFCALVTDSAFAPRLKNLITPSSPSPLCND